MPQRNASRPVPQSIDVHQIPITFFDDKFAAVQYRESMTLPQLADEIRYMTDSRKTRLPWLKLALFGNQASAKGCLRTNANTLEITGIEVDYDGGPVTFDLAMAWLRERGIRALVYTSASYQRGVKEKWRVLCPTSTALAPGERSKLIATLNGVMGGGIDPASFNLSIAFYYGSINDNPDHRVEVTDGDFIDLRPDLVEGAIGKPAATKGEPIVATKVEANVAPSYSDADLDAMLDKSQYKNSDGSGNWWENMRDVVASLVGRGAGDEAILARVMPFAYEDVNVLKFIEGARAKWGIPDPDVPPGARLGPEVLAAIGADAPAAGMVRPAWRELYVETQNPKPTFHNARAAIEALKIYCSADVFHGKLYMGRSDVAAYKLQAFHGEVTDIAIGALRVCLSDVFGLDFGEKHIRDAVVTLCNEHQFNPVTDMLDEAQAGWDGKPRLDRMAVDHFNAADTELNRACVRKTMIAAVARARQPGCKFDTITVLEAPEGWNKSSAWAVLAGEGNFSDESILGKASREVQEQLAGVWIHENAELAGITKSEVEVIKAFASRQTDRARPAYGHLLVSQPRHSIEVGTTNPTQYLLSQTGNRRFWPIEVRAPIDLKRLRESRLQLWGEAAHYQAQGEALTIGEHLWADAAVEQEARRVVHPWESKLAGLTVRQEADIHSWKHDDGAIITVVGDEWRVPSVDLFRYLNVPVGQMHMGHAKTLATIMRMLGWTDKPFKQEGNTVRGYVRTVVTAGYAKNSETQ